jgi:uncharacterized protein YbjT (DUF2867 family)
MILITGATGSVGGALLANLASRNDVGPLRAMYREDRDNTGFPAGVEAIKANFEDAASLQRALAGVQSAYLVCAAIPQLVELETNFLRACARAGTPNVVIQSALGAADFGKSFPSWHRKVEQAAKEMNVPCSIIRPNGFMQNIGGYFAPTIKSQDAFYDALGEARISYIDVRDVARAAAALLLSKQFIGQVFELSGPEPLTHAEIAARISKIVGRSIRYVPLTAEQMKQGMISAGMPETRATPVVELYEYYVSGKGAASDAALRRLIGGEPRRIDAYLAEIAPMLSR